MALKVELVEGIDDEMGFTFTMESLEDFDVYEELLRKQIEMEFFEDYLENNFNSFKEDFEKYNGKTVLNNGNKYKVIAIMDDNAYGGWYWIAQNIDDERDIQYLSVDDKLEFID